MQPWRETAAWLAGVVMLLTALTATAWWVRFPERAWEAARVVADAALPVVSGSRISEVVSHSDGSWKVRTNLPLAGSDANHIGVFFVGQPSILKGLLSFPLLWALLIMGQGPIGTRLAGGTALLAGLVLLHVAANIWLTLAVMLKGEPSFVSAALQPPPFGLANASVSQVEWVLSNLAYYLIGLFGPILSPLLIWALLSWRSWPLRREPMRLAGAA